MSIDVVMPPDWPLEIASRIQDALAEGRAVVALESTLITHGLASPQNLEAARRAEAAVFSGGAEPATINARAVSASTCRRTMPVSRQEIDDGAGTRPACAILMAFLPSIARGERQTVSDPSSNRSGAATPCATDDFLSCPGRAASPLRSGQSIALSRRCPERNWESLISARFANSFRAAKPECALPTRLRLLYLRPNRATAQ